MTEKEAPAEEVEELEEEDVAEDGDEEIEDEDLSALQEELKQTKRALAKANRDAARNRRKAQEGSKDPAESDAKVEKLEGEVRRLHAAEALREAGAVGTKKKVARMVTMLDSIDPSEVDDAIDELRDEFPEFFKAEEEEKPKGKRAPRLNTSDNETKDTKNKGGLSPMSRKQLRAAGIKV